MDRCYQDLSCPSVTFGSFWEVYCALLEKVNSTISLDLVTNLNQSIITEPGEDEGVDFDLAHLKAPELDMRNAVEVDGDEDGDEMRAYLLLVLQ